MNFRISLAVVALASVSASHAAINWHTDQVTWNAATGGATMTEDLSSFAVDTEFRTASVPLTIGSIAQEGLDWNFRNFVDVPPTISTFNNGTSYLALYTNRFEVPIPATTVRITLTGPMTAFGADIYGGNQGEGIFMSAYNGATLLGTSGVPNVPALFLGFDLTGGDVVTSIVLHSATLLPGNMGAGFNMDNLVVAGVPEPATMTILGLGALAAWRRKNRK